MNTCKALNDWITSSTLLPLKLSCPSRISCFKTLTSSIELSQDFKNPVKLYKLIASDSNLSILHFLFLVYWQGNTCININFHNSTAYMSSHRQSKWTNSIIELRLNYGVLTIRFWGYHFGTGEPNYIRNTNSSLHKVEKGHQT